MRHTKLHMAPDTEASADLAGRMTRTPDSTHTHKKRHSMLVSGRARNTVRPVECSKCKNSRVTGTRQQKGGSPPGDSPAGGNRPSNACERTGGNDGSEHCQNAQWNRCSHYEQIWEYAAEMSHMTTFLPPEGPRATHRCPRIQLKPRS